MTQLKRGSPDRLTKSTLLRSKIIKNMNMNRLSCCFSFALFLTLCALDGNAYARGFGGFHGGGFGGYHGGGFGGGGFGGYHGGGFGGGGYHGGGQGFGGSREGGFSDYRGGGFEGGGDRFAGYRGGGFENGGYHGGEDGAYGADRWGGSLNRGQLNGFLGLPTDAGLHSAGSDWAGHGAFNGEGVANAIGTHPYSATYAHAQGLGVQNWAADHPQFTSAWNSAHPWAWSPTGVDAAAWATSAWAGAAWPAVNDWLGWGATASYPYDYGQNITYQGGNVYYGSQPAGTAEQYYQEASNLATSAPTSPSNAQWLPLGVFGLVEKDNKIPSITFQLAVDKEGVLRGNAVKSGSVTTLAVQGSVQKKTQRVCWTVGTNATVVYDTGLDNLIKSEAPILVHSGPTSTQQELLVRMKQPTQSTSGNGSVSSTN
jgi:hypothetical protein